MAKLKKESLVDQVYARLRGDIITLKLPLGSHINVSELQDRLGVSCTPIREAVNRLQQEGLILYENNVGAAVLNLEEHDVQEIQELALTFQKEAARLAMLRGGRERIYREVEEQLGRYRLAESPWAEVEAVHHLIGVFYHHCGNGRLDKSMIAIQGQQLLLRYLHCTWRGHHRDDASFLEMLRGIRTGETQAICRALEDYAQSLTPEILLHLKEMKDSR